MGRIIELLRKKNVRKGQSLLIYDGDCGFCRTSIRRLCAMDPFGALKSVAYQSYPDEKDLAALHPALNPATCQSQMHLLEPNGTLYGGFAAFRRLTLRLPALWLLAPLAYFPGMSLLGNPAYRFIAKNRYLFHAAKQCKDNRCFRN